MRLRRGVFAPRGRHDSRRKSSTALERLERRDCPAGITIAGTQEVSEAGGSVSMRISLSESAAAPVTVDYFLQGDATIGRDYRLTDGTRLLTAPTGTLTFKPGETTKRITVAVLDDTIREPNEWFSLNLFKPRGATLDGQTSAKVTIRDDDNYTAEVTGPGRLEEGASGEYVLRLSSPATKAETFYVNTVSGIATSGIDFRPLTKLPLVFNKGESAKPFRIQTVADALPETDEFFFLQVTPTSADFPAIRPFGVTIAGTGPAPLPEVSIADTSVVEGNSGTTAMTFTLTLSAAYGVPVTVSYATRDGTATTANRDFEGVTNGVVTIPAGLTTATVTINVLSDTNQEPDETFRVVLSAPANATLGRASATGTILNDDTPFTIVVRFPDNTLTPSRKAAFQLAAVRWSQIIIGDLPDVTVNGRVIDDLEITATAPYIDGPYGVLGQAMYDSLRTTGSKLPYSGFMQFDSADLAMMEADGTLQSVILHEMGHVLGIGSLWTDRGLETGYGSMNPVYVGANALREYRTLAGTPSAASIPVENMPRAGSYGAHWRESVFGTELMTSNAEPAGTPMPISRMTVGSLQDLGYVVDYAKADPYAIPAIRASVGVTGSSGTFGPANVYALMSSPSFGSIAAFAVDAVTRGADTPRQRAFAGLARG